ncbi:Alpha-glucosidase [Indibacter alkaliphilus LW1]|uniref:Alpha-glucosidase n=1 Tax=Indibacter alkaliphilus (strain CCUG 57479 / KCTC 22604 / LW1) TaxID=1189612 RepID=S2E7R3_INDAL|nr:glycoside hydrolase family 31 protein [Indibacter alkaliphilus]EOZ98323.1 Alpha-glucosidase [Indibacter alkaliphilus LW1]
MTTLTKSKQSNRNLPIGDVKFWKKEEFGISGNTAVANFKLTVYREDTIRVQVSKETYFSPNPYTVIQDPQTVDFSIKEYESSVVLQTDKLKLELGLSPFTITYYTLDDQVINKDDAGFAVSWLGTEVSNYKTVQENEKFIGLGEKTGGLNRAGNAYTNWNTDYFAYGVNDDPLYMSIPFYIGLHNKLSYGIFFDNTHKTVFNFGASTNRFVYFSAEDGDLDYYFFFDDSVSGIISAYTDLTGKMEIPPLWSLGYQQCRYSYYPESEVLTLAQTFRDKKMPADVIYLDIHHMEKYKVFTFDQEKFPDAKSMIKRLKEKGFKVVVIMDPGIKTENGYLPFDEGMEKDLFVKYPDGLVYEGQVWPGWCAFPDFTKSETREWWAEKMQFYKDAGVDGYWTDMNEPASWGQHTPNLIDFSYEGEEVSHRKARNIYGFQMARSAYEGSKLQSPEERPFILTRSGYSGIQRFAAAWTGDNVATEDHMLAGVRLVNSLGLSGVSFAGYDVGGFAGEASKALFARWMSIATFSPFYRAHSMINSNDAEPWSFGEEVEEISRNYMKLRYRLLPTLYSSFYQSSLDGLPISKSLAIDYAHDHIIYDSAFQNEYIFCDRLLIAPVESTKEITKVYLPEGDWYYLYDSRLHKGNQVIFQDCPTSYLPVYVKAGSILALQSQIYNTGEKNDGILRLHIYKGEGQHNYLHYEDDGCSYEYLEGDIFKRNIIWDSDSLTLKFEKPEGIYSSGYFRVKVYCHGFDAEALHLDKNSIESQKENVAFLDRLTEFDPLPDNLHDFHESKSVATFTFDHVKEAFELRFT